MSLHEIARTHGVQRTDTCKLFWGQYGYSLKMSIPEDFHEERREALGDFWDRHKKGRWKDYQPALRQIHATYRKQLQDHIDTIIDKNLVALEADDFYYQSSDKNTTFYLKSAKVVAVLLANNPGVFHTYSAPRSELVEAHLNDTAGKRVSVREKGWYGEFDHKIVFKWAADYKSLDERVAALRFADSIYSEGDTRILYVTGDDDYFLAKLALSDCIDSVHRCVTVAEVEEGRA